MEIAHLQTINLLLIILQILTFIYFSVKFYRLKVISYTDCLTKLYNRQQYNKKIIHSISKLKSSNSQLSLAIIDIDDFKNVNDTWGHLTGDMVLKSIADMIRNNTRAHDIAIRWGGEEFVLILPNTSKDEAYVLCERIRALIETSSFNTELTRPKSGMESINIQRGLNPPLNEVSFNNINITVSIGIASIDKDTKPDILLDMADKALYNAKKNKNSISTIGGGRWA